MSRVILCLCLLALGFSEARVDFNYSQIYDEYDFWGKTSVIVDSLCRDGCHIFASITEESRKVAANILIQTSKGFTSVADLADRRNATNGQKLSLEVTNTPTLTIVNGNSGLSAGPLVLYIVNQQAPNFAGAEVYEAEGFVRPAGIVYAVTVMSAHPFTLRQAKLEGAPYPNGVLSHLTGFDALMWGTDTCPNLYYLIAAPFPGFEMQINAPIVSLLYDLNQFHYPSGELSATIGISNVMQLQQAGFFNSPGFHGCAGKNAYRSSLYNYNAPSQVDLSYSTPQNIVMDVVTNTDEQHALQFFDSPTGKNRKVWGTTEMTPVTVKMWAQDVIVTWAQDGIVDYHYMVRYNATLV